MVAQAGLQAAVNIYESRDKLRLPTEAEKRIVPAPGGTAVVVRPEALVRGWHTAAYTI